MSGATSDTGAGTSAADAALHAADKASAARINISRWALEHAALTRYLLVVLILLGAAAYFQLGQDEDPPLSLIHI